MNEILVALGANLPSRFGNPKETILTAYQFLQERGVLVAQKSRIWLTEPVPVSDQPWYHNAVCRVESSLDPAALLALLHEIEAEFGRVRSIVNAPRVIDLDLLAHGRQVIAPEQGMTLPHPRLHERAFVLLPLQEVAPDWVHPVSGEGLEAMIARLPAGQKAVVEE